jgi:hypothetical protein
LVGPDEVALTALSSFGTFVNHSTTTPFTAGLGGDSVPACRPSVEVPDIDGGVETLVCQCVGERLTDSRAILAAVTVRPLCSRVDYILFDDEAARIASDFPSTVVHLPIDDAALFARPGVSFECSSDLMAAVCCPPGGP